MELGSVVGGVTVKRGGVAAAVVTAVKEEDDELDRSPRTGIPLDFFGGGGRGVIVR